MITEWKYSNDGNSASRVLDDGSIESRLVSAIPADELTTALASDPLTLEEQFLAIERALDKHIDDIAAARGYGRIGVSPSAACLGYAGYANQWQAEATKFGQWVTACWTYTIQEQQAIVAGTRTMPTPAEAILELPTMVW